MADNTTTTTPQSNGVPLSGLPALTAPVNGEELLLITKNNQSLKTTAAALKAYINAEVATLTGMQQAVKAVSDRIDTLVNGDASSAIDTFNEIEAFLTGITDTETLTGLLAELKSAITTETDNKLSGKVDKVAGKGLSANDYTDTDKAKLTALPNKSELDSSLGAKLDKSEWDEEHGQFGIAGWVNKLNGQFTVEPYYMSSELLPLNHNYDLVFYAIAFSNAASVSFYTADGTWISSIQEQAQKETILSKSEFPPNASFVRFTAYTSEVSRSYYRNGETIESREGAVSEAIQATLTAAVDEALIAEATAAGAVYNRATGYFELNTLTDITAAQMRTILAAGARQSSTLSAAYISSAIRTHLPRVGMGQAAYAESTFYGCSSLETVEMSNLKLQGYVFSYCTRLRSVNCKSTQIYDLNNTAKANFQGCSKLVELRGTLRSNFDFNIADSPLLSLASLQHLVTNAANTTAISVTVHPDVYAKLTDESNAEWHAVLTAAEAKNINFATTE